VTRWLLVRGTGASPLPAAVDGARLTRHSSSRRPAVQAGDLAILYAAVWQVVFAVVEVGGPPEHDPTRERWSWSFTLLPVMALSSLEEAPPVEATGVFPQSLWRHSHVRLTDEQFAAAHAAIALTLVAHSYDAVAPRYARWAARIDSPVGAWLQRLVDRLPAAARVLDLGCGNGIPVARTLVDAGHEVIGVDASRTQVGLARRNVPEADLVRADALDVEFPPASFDAVASTFVFGHIPRAEQPVLLDRIRRWLRPGGLLLLTMATGDTEDELDPDWHGAPTFWASFDPETNAELVARAGFEVAETRVVAQDEPGHGVSRFQWFLARA
jgi:SAM-dependent methyltransferase